MVTTMAVVIYSMNLGNILNYVNYKRTVDLYLTHDKWSTHDTADPRAVMEGKTLLSAELQALWYLN